MRIREIHFEAFGPFTDTILRFDGDNPGLNIIYGPNEAGKSSALKGLKYFFFGFPRSTKDNFIHPYSRFRIKCLLENADNEVLCCVRKKGKTNTLLTEDEKELVSGKTFSRFLGGVDKELFDTLFCISHEELVQGGASIARGEGELGAILFSAGSGIAGFPEIIREMGEKAKSLYAPTGKVKPVNQAISRYKEIRREKQQSILYAHVYRDHTSRLEKARSRILSISREIREKQVEKNRMERIKKAAPLFAVRSACLKELEALKDAPVLPEDFPIKRHTLFTRMKVLTRKKEENENRKKELEKTIQSICERQEVRKKKGASPSGQTPDTGAKTDRKTFLQNKDLILSLYRESGTQDNREKERIALLAKKDAAVYEAKARLLEFRKDMDIDDAESLRPEKAKVVRIRELGKEISDRLSRIAVLEKTISSLEKKAEVLANQKKEMPQVTGTKALEQALKEAMREGDMEARLKEVEKACQKEKKAIDSLYENLGFSPFLPEKLVTIPLPMEETIEKTAAGFEKNEQQRIRIKEDIDRLSEQIAEIRKNLAHLDMEREVPTEADLAAFREKRDLGWSILRRQLEDRPPAQEDIRSFLGENHEENTLIPAYEKAVGKADAIADRLRREAGRVEKKSSLVAEEKSCMAKYDKEEEKLGHLEKEYQRQIDDWELLWKEAGFSPLSPKEMQAFCRKIRQMKEKWSVLEDALAGKKQMEDEICSRKKALLQIMEKDFPGHPGLEKNEISLSRAKDTAEAIVEEMQKRNSAIREIDAQSFRVGQDLQEAQKELHLSREALNEVKTLWEEALSPLGLPREASPSQADAVIEQMNAFFQATDKKKDLENRIIEIDMESSRFQERVRGIYRSLFHEDMEKPAKEGIQELYAGVLEEEKEETEKTRHEKEVNRIIREQNRIKEETDQCEAELLLMLKEACCSTQEEFNAAEERSFRKKKLLEKKQNLEDQLEELCAGDFMDAFHAQVTEQMEKTGPDGMDHEIGMLKTQTEELEETRNALLVETGEMQKELSQMNGESHAALLAQEEQSAMAKIAMYTEQYLNLRIAELVLSAAMDEYQKKHRAPFLEEGGRFFSKITKNSFAGLTLKVEGPNRISLAGIRNKNKDHVLVSEMSEGTCDQLYLSLRLSGIRQYLEKNPPLPLMVDDILVNFDDERALATLEILNTLSKDIQILFFTHHKHLIELARHSCDRKNLHIHTLSV